MLIWFSMSQSCLNLSAAVVKSFNQVCVLFNVFHCHLQRCSELFSFKGFKVQGSLYCPPSPPAFSSFSKNLLMDLFCQFVFFSSCFSDFSCFFLRIGWCEHLSLRVEAGKGRLYSVTSRHKTQAFHNEWGGERKERNFIIWHFVQKYIFPLSFGGKNDKVSLAAPAHLLPSSICFPNML